jgi:DHA2 family methylenomycin A resistance protein-like MFS transporter
VSFGLSGVLFVLSLYFQEAHGCSASVAGAAFLPLTVPTAFNPIFTGRIVARVGTRIPATIGFLMMAAGTAVQAICGGTSALDVTISMTGPLLLGLGFRSRFLRWSPWSSAPRPRTPWVSRPAP